MLHSTPPPPPPSPPAQPIAAQRLSAPSVSAVTPVPASGGAIPQLSQVQPQVPSTSAADLVVPRESTPSPGGDSALGEAGVAEFGGDGWGMGEDGEGGGDGEGGAADASAGATVDRSEGAASATDLGTESEVVPDIAEEIAQSTGPAAASKISPEASLETVPEATPGTVPRPAAAAGVRPEAPLTGIAFSSKPLTFAVPRGMEVRAAPAVSNRAIALENSSPGKTVAHQGDRRVVLSPPSEPDQPNVATLQGQSVTTVAQPGSEPGVPAEPAPGERSGDRPGCSSGTSIVVDSIVVSCSTILNEAVLTEILQPFLGRSLAADEQQQAADAITRYYLEAGYITSRARLQAPAAPGQPLRLEVIEGGIDSIVIEGRDRLSEDYLRSRIGLATQPPLNTTRLEDQLRLLRQSPLLDNIEASLLPGTTPGNSTLRVRVDEADPFSAYVGLDNYSPPVLGTTQGTLALTHQNLTGRGDRLSGSLVRTTTGGRTTTTLGYALPLNPMEGTLQVNATFENTRIPLVPGLDVSGSSQTYGISFRQPLIRTPQEELALSLGFDYQNGQTFIGDQPLGAGLGADANGISRTAVVRFGQDYVSRDLQGAWALRSRFSLGTGLFGATVNADPLPDGQFVSWLGQAQRVQRLSDDHLLIISADVQLTPDPLLSSEKFVIGGAQTVRGYRQNLVGGDNGFRVSVEDRITLQRDEAGLPTLQLAPFVDMGSVWNVGRNPSPAPVQGFLVGLGLGLIWEPTPQLNLRVDYGLPLINSPSRGNSWQEQGIYFQLGYRL